LYFAVKLKIFLGIFGKNLFMKLSLIVVGKTSEAWLEEAISVYEKRLQHYVSFKIQVLPSVKNAHSYEKEKLKEKEGEMILKSLQPADHVVLLDEAGKQFTSVGFSEFVGKNMGNSVNHLVFIVGGAFGVSEEVKSRAYLKMALSQMTFSHQMVRLIFVEQLYRAMTILKNESYHHI
jgi:23S rRNA (pseudouridine1915-N3)-methyltransferase